MFRHPAVLRQGLLTLSAIPGLLIVNSWSAKILVHNFGLKQAALGHYLWLSPLLFDIGCVAFGDLASRCLMRGGYRPLVLMAGLLEIVLVAVPHASGPFMTVAIAGVAAAGAGGLYALGTADLLGRVPPGAVSRASGLMATAQSLGIVVSGPLIGRSVDYFGNYNVATAVAAFCVLPGVAVWLAWEPGKALSTGRGEPSVA